MTLLTLRPDRWKAMTLPLGTGWLLSACTEAKGKQDLWARQKPEVLAALREQAFVQSNREHSPDRSRRGDALGSRFLTR